MTNPSHEPTATGRLPLSLRITKNMRPLGRMFFH
jgi:hypothetical protein